MNRYAYMPFGGGGRGCIGSIFAMQEATLVVATLMSQFTFDLAAGAAVWPMHRVTLCPRAALPMVVRPRSDRVAHYPDASGRRRKFGRAKQVCVIAGMSSPGT